MRGIDFMLAMIMVGLLALGYIWQGFEEEKVLEQIRIEKAKALKIEQQKKEALAKKAQKKVPISKKKKNFYNIIVPAVHKVHNKWRSRYERLANDINNTQYAQEFEVLKKRYKAQSDEELLASLKPHPPSITIAQAAMESAWATSRFFVEANNVFGVWSVGSQKPRIAASVQRDNNTTIWLRKFESVDEAVNAYYDMMARVPAYEEFRQARLISDDPYEILLHLDKYSEIGEVYPTKIEALIRYNKLTKYDMLFEEPYKELESQISE